MHFLHAVAAIAAFAVSTLAADNVPPAHLPPSPITVEQAPMFVSFGWDDNSYTDAVEWIRTFTDTLTNKDGSPVRMTFFNSAGYGTSSMAHPDVTPASLIAAWKNIYSNGHEIANHTFNHYHGGGVNSGKNFDQAGWEGEMSSASDFFTQSLQIPADSIFGFRTPFLEFNSATFDAVKAQNFVYDCSVEWGYNGGFQLGDKYYGALDTNTYKNLFWPFTLDGTVPQGSPYSSNAANNHPGIWELPVYDLVSPNLGFQLTGFDYNIWTGEKKVPEFDQQGYYDYLKWHFDLRHNAGGNKAPYCINVHTDYYSPLNTTFQELLTKTTAEQRRAAVQDFITYVIQFEDVRIVPYITLVQWMQNPVPTSSYTAPTQLRRSGTTPVVQSASAAAANGPALRVSGRTLSLTSPRAGELSISLMRLNGSSAGLYRLPEGTGLRQLSLPASLPAGIYVATVKAAGFSVTERVDISR